MNSVEILPVFEKVVENDDLVILEKMIRRSEAEITAKEYVLANPFIGILCLQSGTDCGNERFGEVRFSKTGTAGHSHYPGRRETEFAAFVGEFGDSCGKPLQTFAEFCHFGILRLEIFERGFRTEVFNAVITVSSVFHRFFSGYGF